MGRKVCPGKRNTSLEVNPRPPNRAASPINRRQRW